MKKQVLVEILIGLPGSGKTHYAQTINGEKFLNTYNNKTCYIDFDASYKKNYTLTRVLMDSDFPRGILQENKNWNHWIFDGLFLTNESQKNLLDAMQDICKKNKVFDEYVINVRFVYFKENREACLFNNSFREDSRQAQITIKNANIERPMLKEYAERYGLSFDFSIKEKNVRKMNLYEIKFKSKESYEKQDEMHSEEWSLGGTWGNCWGDSGTISASEKPNEFKEFDDLLLDICPNITLLQYKKLYRETVSIGTRHEYDYYGGSCTYEFYSCDLKKLYDMLVEMNLINA